MKREKKKGKLNKGRKTVGLGGDDMEHSSKVQTCWSSYSYIIDNHPLGRARLTVSHPQKPANQISELTTSSNDTWEANCQPELSSASTLMDCTFYRPLIFSSPYVRINQMQDVYCTGSGIKLTHTSIMYII